MKDDLDARVIDLAIRMGFVGLFIFAALSLIAPMAGLIIWAVILTVAVYPLYVWLARQLGGRERTAATLITLLGVAITLGPVAILISSLISGLTTLAEHLGSGQPILPPPPDRLLDWPVIGPALHDFWTDAAGNVGALMASHGGAFLSAGSTVLARVADIGIGLLLMMVSVILMGLMFRPGPTLAAETRRFANRVFAPRGGALIDLAGATVRNVSRGVVGVAILQGLLAGIVMLVFGIKAAGVLALIAMLLAIIQIGPGPVLIPTIIWAWTAMTPGMAALFTIVMLPVMVIDNILRPIFISRGLQTPMLVILVGVLGGMVAYGLIGLFVGPVVLAVFYELFIGWVEADEPTATSTPQDRPSRPEP